MSERMAKDHIANIKHAINIGAANSIEIDLNIATNSTYNILALKEVGHSIRKFIGANNLQVDYNTETVLWNDQYKCWEYNIKIIDEKSAVKSDLADREIKVKIFNKESNTKQNSQDYINRLNNLAASAQDLIKQILPGVDLSKYIKQIQEQQLLLNTQLKLLDPSKQDNHAVAVKCFQVFNSYVAATLKALYKEYPTGIAIKLKHLGYINSAVDRRCTKGIPKKTKGWLKLLSIHESRFTAIKKRDVLFNLYPVNDVWVMNNNVPLSDIPSTLRNGSGNVLPNWFRSETNIFTVENNKCHKLDFFAAERSSSFSAIAVNKLFRSRINEEIAKNKIKILTRNKIIATLNQLTPAQLADININDIIKDCFNQELMLTTLLNLPFKHKEENKLPEAFSESPQFKDGKKSLANIKQLTLSEQDVNYIVAHMKPDVKRAIPGAEAALRLYLESRKITCKTIFHNFASSVLRKLSREKSYNQQALESVQQAMFDLLKQQPQHASFNLQDIRDIKKLKLLYNDMQDTEIKKTVSLYIKYIDLLKKSSKDAKDNFMLQIFSSLVGCRLGKEIHITCKSGEDRTGATFVAIDCALSVMANLQANNNTFNINNPKDWQLFRDAFWDHYANIEQFSASREITDMNAIGARGLQSQSKKSNFLRSIVSPIYKKMIVSDRMARISKLAFKKYFTNKKRQKFFDLCTPNTNNKHGLMMFTKNPLDDPILNKHKQPTKKQ